MKGWKAWYTDGRVFSSSSTTWTDLPESGVLGVVIYREGEYRDLVYGGDWYYLGDDGEPTATETHTEWGKWVPKPDAPSDEIKQAEAVSDEYWDQIQTEMMEAKSWP